ncbi:MAG TPA: tetraacyldisaccharide 4'-kinase [Terriglobales bacterium]|nr:tetraacyldisaccharide 4'-kinase [Terriglobales bacterium]
MMLSSVYSFVTAFRNQLYDRDLLAARRLARPVVSVGNISTGGSGKTPFVIALGELLQARGISFDVLSRGYGRKSTGVRVVDPAGLPEEFGDEPLLIARKLKVPVVVGEDRYQAGAAAEKLFETRLHLLDDGFQHRQLARDFDVVLVTPEEARDRLLPRGRLREALTALRRADAVVLMSGAEPHAFPAARAFWRARRGILATNVPPRPVAFCAIARPKNFFLQLTKAGIEPAGEAVFRDHHRYTKDDVHELLHLAQKCDAGGFVTTEKDAVNLGGYFSSLKPLAVVPVKMELVDAQAAIDAMLDAIARRRGRPV